MVFSTEDVWYPRLDIINAISNTRDEVALSNVRVFSYGLSVMAWRTVMEASCSIDVKYYPFDTQVPFFYNILALHVHCVRLPELLSYLYDNIKIQDPISNTVGNEKLHMYVKT